MPLTAARRSALELAREAGAEAQRAQRTLGLYIVLDGVRVRLREPSGRLTEAGMVFFPAGAPLPFDHNQDPVQVGRSEYIQMYDGGRQLIRWMVGGAWTYFTQTCRV